MNRRYIALIWSILLISHLQWLAAEEPAVTEVLDDRAATIVWQRLVESRHNLEILDKAKLITEVPALPNDKGVTPQAAASASLVQYYDNTDHDLSAKRGSLVPTVREYLKDKGGLQGRAIAEKSLYIVGKLCKEYNDDLFRSATVLNRRFSQGECYVRVMQAYSANIGKNEPLRDAATAIASFANARDFKVTAIRKDATWNECCETLARDMPFLCSFGASPAFRVYLCVGYAEGKGRKYLIAVSPTACQTKVETIPSGNRTSQNDSASGTTLFVGHSDAAHRTDYMVKATIDMPPGIVVLQAPSGSLPCLFVYNWSRDRMALTKRIERLINKEEMTTENKGKGK